MSKNAGKYFLSGFQPNFARGFDTSYRAERFSQERDETREYERKLKEEDDKRKAAEQEKSMQTVNRLLQGGRSGQTLRGGKPMFAPDDKQTQMKLASGLSASDINKVQDIQSMFKPEKDEYTGIDYSNKDAVYGFNKRTNRLEKIQDGNPIYKPKKVRDATGYNSKGEKTITEWYDDDTTKIIDTGYRKSFNSEGKEVETFDADKFNKTLNSFTEQDIKINRLKSEYTIYPDEATKYEINTLNQTNAATLYSLMPDDSKAIVDQFYDQLKGEAGKRGVDYTQFEKQKQNELKKKFQIAVGQNFDGSSESYAKNRALILYSNFKYGYVE